MFLFCLMNFGKQQKAFVLASILVRRPWPLGCICHSKHEPKLLEEDVNDEQTVYHMDEAECWGRPIVKEMIWQCLAFWFPMWGARASKCGCILNIDMRSGQFLNSAAVCRLFDGGTRPDAYQPLCFIPYLLIFYRIYSRCSAGRQIQSWHWKSQRAGGGLETLQASIHACKSSAADAGQEEKDKEARWGMWNHAKKGHASGSSPCITLYV